MLAVLCRIPNSSCFMRPPRRLYGFSHKCHDCVLESAANTMFIVVKFYCNH
jgi:hypothetical protein